MELQGLISPLNAKLSLWLRLVTVVREFLNPPFVSVRLNLENNQLCGFYSWFIETKI